MLKVCEGMSAAILFLKQHKYLGISECLKAAKEALPSVEFHTNSDFLKIFVDVCSSNSHQISENYELTKIVEGKCNNCVPCQNEGFIFIFVVIHRRVCRIFYF